MMFTKPNNVFMRRVRSLAFLLQGIPNLYDNCSEETSDHEDKQNEKSRKKSKKKKAFLTSKVGE